MKQFTNASAMATVLAALVLMTGAATATEMEANAGGQIQLAHGMDQGARGGAAPGGMMGPGMMGPGMMGRGMMGPGMMGPGMMGGGMMGGGMMPCPGAAGQSMGPGMMGWGTAPGMMGPGFGGRIVAPAKDLSADDVRHFLEHRLAWQGNKRVKLGEVKEVDDHAIVAEIVTVDGSLVQRLNVDRHTGQMQQAE